MQLQFSERPGAHERQLRRKLGREALFDVRGEISRAQLDEAQRRDEAEAMDFEQDLNALLTETVGLESNAPSEKILELKDRIDVLYARAAGLRGDQSQVQMALQRLITVVMDAIRAAAQGDVVAQAKLDEEEMARRMHFDLLREPLAADLLRPDPIIAPHELVPTLLSETGAAVSAAFTLFAVEHQAQLCADARVKLNELGQAGHELTDAWRRLEEMEALLSAQSRNQ